MNSGTEKCRCSSRLVSNRQRRPRRRPLFATAETTFSQQVEGRRLGKATGIAHLAISVLLLLVIYLAVAAKATEDTQSKSSRVQQLYSYNATTTNSTSTTSEQQATDRLDCRPGEQRHFSYESSTRVWGSNQQQQVRMRASLRLRCLETQANGTLKYLVEILALTPAFESPNRPLSETGTLRKDAAAQLRAKLMGLNADWERDARAEPVFEEVADAISVTATRVKRSVSGWFSKTWVSVKDFFGNIFSSSEKSSVSREQAFRESGLDIAGQCKSKSGSGSGKSGSLPIDESVFDDLEPKYYIGASLDSPGGSTTHYDFDERADELDSDSEDANLSFFDDPPKVRNRRAAGGKSSGKPSASAIDGAAHERLIKLPFVLLQSPLGRIVDVRFGSEDIDVSVKNFKRHLCDLFATNLDRSRTQLSETSPIGQHATKYLLDESANSEAIRQTLVKAASLGSVGEEQAASKPLVRVLAMTASQQQLERDMSFMEDIAGNQVNATGQQQQVDQKQPAGVSVLRTVNSTNSIQLNSRTIAPDIERMQVEVRQVQHISGGRLTGTAGQLAMSLLQSVQGATGRSQRRTRRSTSSNDQQEVGDIADLLQVSTSFSVQLVPASRLTVLQQVGTPEKARRVSRSLSATHSDSDGDSKKLADDDNNSHKGQVNGLLRQTGVNKTDSSAQAAPSTSVNKRRTPREPLVSRPPSDQAELEQVLQDWRKLEQRLQLSSAGMAAESSTGGGRQEGQQQRLEVLRDQIQMRLNEESMRNRLRRSASSRRTAASSATGSSSADTASGRSSSSANDLGLGLSQLVLDSGITSRRKGSVYATIEEALELESSLDEDKREGSMSHLLRNTARIDKLRQHCRSAVATLDEIRAQKQRLELRTPFNLPPETEGSSNAVDNNEPPPAARWSVARLTDRNRKRLDQCQQVLRVLLRAGERQAAELTLELVDECNRRLLAGSRDEELGWGPTSRYYRSLRQQFMELLPLMNRPGEALLDKLVARLHHPKLPAAGDTSPPSHHQEEFTYVSQSSSSRYNRSLLREEDDYNNNESAGSLVMIITALASRPTIGRAKRNELADKLLSSLSKSSGATTTTTTAKAATCSVFSAPDLDVLEAMANFQEPLDESVSNRIVQLARRCRHQDQYLVASIHALSGQVRQSGVQKFLNELLRSSNTSCTVKSEIVLTLMSVITANEFRWPPVAASNSWPMTGTNQLDETLLELVNERSGKRLADRKCLSLLVSQYMSKKQHQQQVEAKTTSGGGKLRGSRSRNKRSVANEDGFWDEAQCRRWQLPSEPQVGSNSPGSDLVDEIDDNSILQAIASSRSGASGSVGRARNLKLLERELESPMAAGNGSSPNEAALIRKRHKCSASKTYGPKNAQATLRTDIVNDLIGPQDENKFLARFRLATNFLGNRIDVGRMYLWHQKRTTRAHVNILGKSLWDTSHGCQDKAPQHLVYMPLFDFNLWLVKVSVGLRLQSEMGFFGNCEASARDPLASAATSGSDQLELFPSVSLRASGEASAKFVVARAGMSLASQYSYQGNIRVSRQPESCMSIYSGHQPMNVTFSSWFQLFDNDCHYWGSRNRAEPQATKWRLLARKPTKWLEDECLAANPTGTASTGAPQAASRSLQSISP